MRILLPHLIIVAGLATTLLTRPAAAQIELLTEGGFENAPSGFTANSGVHEVGDWRWFAVAGATATVETVTDTHSGARALRLTRTNTVGDTALDRDTPTLRVPVQPGRRYLATVWAKSSASSRLILRMPLFNAGGTFLGIENQSLHQLTPTWTQYTALMTAAPNAAFCSMALRLDGIGEMVVDDLSLKELSDTPPVVALPVGITTDLQPRIQWRSMPFTAFEVVISDQASSSTGIVWTSGIVASTASHVIPPALPQDTTFYTFVRVQGASGWTAWSERLAPFRIQPVPQPTNPLITFDLAYTRNLSPGEAFQHAHLVAALQGIVNRETPRLFVTFNTGWNRNVDTHWLSRLREPGRWLAQRPLVPISSISDLVEHFRDSVDGLVVWDSQVPATSNVASTIAGADNLLPVPRDTAPGSLYTILTNAAQSLPVVIDLEGKFTGFGTIPDTVRTSSGSPKCDAYLWALELYLKTGKVDPGYMGFYIDAFWINNPTPGGDLQNHTLTNHDYFISRKGFFWDLHVWGDEKPIDDPLQPMGADLNTLKEIMAETAALTAGERMIHVGGFTPWAFKYTNEPDAGGNYGPVHTEWETVRLLSAYNAYIDADALGVGAMANASLYRHLPLPGRYTQPLPPQPHELRARGLLDSQNNVVPKTYLLHYVGDYDSAAWINSGMPQHWDNFARGNVTLPWALNPNLVDRVPHVFEYLYRTRTALDAFMAGDSGAGYVNPTQLLPPRSPSTLPSAVVLWQQHCRRYYSQFGLGFTGFLINGLAGPITQSAEAIYTNFSPDGIVNHIGHNSTLHLENNMPVFQMASDLSDNISASAALVASHVSPGTLQFLVYRSILKSASYYSTINSAIRSARPESDFVFCDPATFSYLARRSLGAANRHRSSILFDTFPATAQTSDSSSVGIAIRNDGWETWPGGGAGAFKLMWEATTNGEFLSPQQIDLPRPVPPGDSIVLEIQWTAPSTPGRWFIRYETATNSGTPFSTYGNTPGIVTIDLSAPSSTVEDYWMY